MVFGDTSTLWNMSFLYSETDLEWKEGRKSRRTNFNWNPLEHLTFPILLLSFRLKCSLLVPVGIL